MTLAGFNTTTKKDIVKPLQYVTEGNTVTTPANYGTTPTSATFTLVGNNTEITPRLDVRMMTVDVLGSEDIVDAVKTEALYAFSIKFNPIDTALWKYVWNAGGQTSGPDSSLSFTYSYYRGGTQYYQHFRGCRATSGTLSLNRGIWECNITFVAQSISVPATSTSDPGTPVYQSSETTSSPVTHTDGGGSPFTWNSVTYGERSFSVSVTRELAVTAVNGETNITYCKPVSRKISYSVDVFVGTASQLTTLYSDFENKTARTSSYKFTASPSKTLTFTNSRIDTLSFTHAAGSNDALIETLNVIPETVTDL